MKRSLFLTILLVLGLLPFAAFAGSAQWDANTATYITFAGADIVVDGQGATVAGNTVTIDTAGTYVLRGTLTDGQVVIAATKEDDITLVLDGVHIASSTSAPIYASKVRTLTVILSDGTSNVLVDAVTYAYTEDTDEPDATLFCKDNMVITGTGSLSVTGNYRNGIAAKDGLTVEDGNITITAAHDGIRGRDSLTILGGTLSVNAANDGIKANNDEDAEKGWIVISGGTIAVTSGCDAIQAETTLTVEGGTLLLTAGGGSENAAPRTNSDGMGGRGWMQQSTPVEETETDSMEGLKAGVALTVMGGSITIDAADDTLHANGDVTISGGDLTLKTGDDGVHADAALVISSGSIYISESYEGLEGATVTISGGDIHLYASDDGINAAGGTDGESGMFGMDFFRSGGSDSYWIEITGGNIWVSAGTGDGIDSNGNLTISGGEVVVHGSGSQQESPLDTDGAIYINGGTVIAAGSTGQFRGIDGNSTQPSVLLYCNSAKQAGTNVALYDAAGNIIAEYTAESSFPTILFSSPALTVGETYAIATGDGDPVPFTLTGTATTISEDGSAAGGSGGWSMPNGGAGRQQNPGGRGQQGGTAPSGEMPAQTVPGAPQI